MTSKVVYKGGLRTEATHLKSGNVIITDAPTDNHGKGEAFSPPDLVATALGSCMITIAGIVADKHGIDMEGTTAAVNKIMESDPRRIGTIEIVITFPAKGYEAKERKLLEAALHHCPVGNTIQTGVEKVSVVWKDDE